MARARPLSQAPGAAASDSEDPGREAAMWAQAADAAGQLPSVFRRLRVIGEPRPESTLAGLLTGTGSERTLRLAGLLTGSE